MGSIYDAQIGAAEEATWGTYVAPDTFIEFLSESLQRQTERVESEGLGYGARVLREAAYEDGRIGVEGDVEVEVPDRGFQLFGKYMLGKVTTVPGGEAGTYVHTCEFDVLDGNSLTFQVGRPDSAGVVQPFSYTGCKVNEWELSNEVDGLLTASLSIDGREESQSETLAVKSFPAGARKLAWVGGAVTVDGVGARVKSVSFSGSNGLRVDRYYIQDSESQYKEEQLEGDGMRDYSGEVTCEWGDVPGLYESFISGTPVAISALWQGRLIPGAATTRYSFEVEVASARIDGETPNVGGAEAIEQNAPFKVLWDEVESPVKFIITDDQPALA